MTQKSRPHQHRPPRLRSVNTRETRARFRAKLRDFEIFPAWKAILDDTFALEPEPITINWTYAEQLKKQSMETRARLIVDEDKQEEKEPAQESSRYHISEELEVKQSNITILTLLRSYEWMASASVLQKLYEDQFIQIVVDRLNEWAYEMFGDVIVVQEGDYYSLLEEYREDIVTLLDKLSQT